MFKNKFIKFVSILLSSLIMISTMAFSNTVVNAAELNGFKQTKATWYYYQNGAMASGWVKDSGTWYFLNTSGAMVTNAWIGDYYLGANGAMITGWVNDRGNWYFLETSGIKVTNTWIENYYLASSGILVTNAWIGDYYLGANGAREVGWVNDRGNWYFLKTSGEKVVNTWIGNYYLGASGIMMTGWVKDRENWYFLETSGCKAMNVWIEDYYLGASGIMLVGTVTPDGYTVDADGVWDKEPSVTQKATIATLKAEASVVQANIDEATGLVNKLYDETVKTDLIAKLCAINTKSENDFTLYQLPPARGDSELMMSYVIKTKHNKIIVIDGGPHGQTAYLRNFINSQGGQVDSWIVTHPHSDHIDALIDILLNPQGITINKIYTSLPERSLVVKYEPESIEDYDIFVNALSKSKLLNQEVKARQKLDIDGVSIEFLSAKNPELTNNVINNSCVAFKVTSPSKTVLFLGDTAIDEGNKMLREIPGTVLKSEYVQMAHHGQDGVSKEFYKTVSPEYCLWPIPKWLWDNNPGTGYNTGIFSTIIVRGWMDELGVKKSYQLFNGLAIII